MGRLDLKNKTVLVTGAAGFIGSNLVLELLKNISPITIIGVDSMNNYYDVSIKEYRLEQIEKMVNQLPKSVWKFINGSIADKKLIESIFNEYKPSVVVNFAAHKLEWNIWYMHLHHLFMQVLKRSLIQPMIK